MTSQGKNTPWPPTDSHTYVLTHTHTNTHKVASECNNCQEHNYQVGMCFAMYHTGETMTLLYDNVHNNYDESNAHDDDGVHDNVVIDDIHDDDDDIHVHVIDNDTVHCDVVVDDDVHDNHNLLSLFHDVVILFMMID